MSGPDAIHVDGVVVEHQANGLIHVELANGYRLLGYAAHRDQQQLISLKIGQIVKLEMTVFDMSKARILV